jgi:hypothetical protein
MPQDQDALKHEAARYGLTKLSDEHLAQFAAAKAAVERLLGRIPRDLHMYEEPAHTFRASQEVRA